MRLGQKNDNFCPDIPLLGKTFDTPSSAFISFAVLQTKFYFTFSLGKMFKSSLLACFLVYFSTNPVALYAHDCHGHTIIGRDKIEGSKVAWPVEFFYNCTESFARLGRANAGCNLHNITFSLPQRPHCQVRGISYLIQLFQI